MDLLFSRYASPFSILDQYIQFGNLYELVDTIQTQRAEEKCWQLYLSIPFREKSYNEFRDDLLYPDKNIPSVKEQKDIVNDSMNLIDSILGGE